jgi:hypothetical protein
MPHTTTIKTIYKAISNDVINAVDFEMVFTIDASSFTHPGFIPFKPALPADATEADMLAAVDGQMAAHLPELTRFYTEIAAMDALKAQSVAVPVIS